VTDIPDRADADGQGPLLLTGATVVTPDEALPGGSILIDQGRIVAALAANDIVGIRLGPPGRDLLKRATTIELPGGYVTPGLIDLHTHGAAGASHDDGAAAIATAVAAQRRHGTTSTMVSLITGAPETMLEAIRGAAEATRADPRILGIHLEGPFLSPLHRGAHDPAMLRDPDVALFEQFVAAGDGAVRMITAAPELPGGMGLVRAAVAAGVHVAVGHCDATYAQAAGAFAAGADIVTHAFNAMRPLHHREPGVIAAARDAGVVLEAINDGVHLHDATVRLLHAVAPGRIAFVTDAMAAACSDDGHYLLGTLDVDVVDGVARLTGGGSIAGSTLTMDTAVRRAVTQVGLGVVEAVNAATLVPAALLGLADEIGALAPAHRADVVIFDGAWQITGMLLGGRWADERRPGREAPSYARD
jgi:N-acetylglucosamine-6-phosphate deacetylase